MQNRRDFHLRRGHIDMETGEFEATVATNGEAADGHILNVQGAEVPESVPLFVNHQADPTTRMGSLSSPRKEGKANRLGSQRLRMTARIDLEGDTAAADIRRDVAQGISLGDITGMSVRWDAVGESVPRDSLSKSHWAYSDAGARSYAPSMYFAEWRMLETSIVGVPADAAAMIGRSHDLDKPDHVRAFYRELTEGDPDAAVARMTELEEHVASLEARVLAALEGGGIVEVDLDAFPSSEAEPVDVPAEDVTSRSEPVDVPSLDDVLGLIGKPILNDEMTQQIEAIAREMKSPEELFAQIAPDLKRILYRKRGIIG